MALEIAGKLHHKYDTVQVSDKFKKREFILDITEDVNGKVYPNYAKMQVTQDKCSVLDSYKAGEEVKVSFNIRGNKAQGKDGKAVVYTNLEAWKIERIGTQQVAQPQQYSTAPQSQPKQEDDSLPF